MMPPPSLLDARDLSGATPKRVRSGVVVPFTNENFEGEMLLFVRDPALPTQPSGPGKRYWELQVQGRFRRAVPNFYMGMELSEPIKMSLLLRGISSTFLGFVRSIEQDIHTSFGSSKNDNTELPHLVTPLFKGVDAVIETVDGSGESPPALGSDIFAGRKYPKSDRPSAVRLDAIYTFSVFSTFIDIFAWKIKGVPAIGAMDMLGFFKDASLRIVAYTVPQTEGLKKKDKVHLQGEKSYLLCLHLEPPHLRPQGNSPSGADILVSAMGGSGKKLWKQKSRRSRSGSVGDSGGRASRSSSRAPAAAEAPATSPVGPTRPRHREELPVAPPLFREAISAPAAVADGRDSETEELAQQRLLMWMAGSPPSRPSHRRALSDPSRRRASKGESPAGSHGWRTRLLAVVRFRKTESAAEKRAKASPWADIVPMTPVA